MSVERVEPQWHVERVSARLLGRRLGNVVLTTSPKRRRCRRSVQRLDEALTMADRIQSYRSIRPELSSSSPLANLQELSSSEPISPGSPSPASRRIDGLRSSSASTARPNAFLNSPTNSHPDPFSANAKASPNSHPSFGKDQLRRKHMRDSPQASAELRSTTWSRHSVTANQDALGRHFFDSSDDNLSSDPGTFSFAAAGTSRSSTISSANMSASGARTGLGIHSSIDVDVKEGLPSSSFNANTMLLGEAFQEPVSPTLGKAGRTRPFKRNISSSRDPMSGVGTLDLPMTEAQDVANRSVSSTGSPRVRRDAQRRRLVGTSPKKLSRAAETGRFDKEDAEDDDDDLGPAWEQRVSKSTQTNSSFDWHAEIRRFYDRVDSTLVLDGRGLTSIDPAVADLAKYVMLNKLSMLQKNDDATSTPPSSGSTPFSRTNSLANANDALSTGSPSSQRTRSNNGALTQQMNSGPQLNFANNDIHQLPSALFAVTNMTMLSIRGNKIGRLPAAIGHLVNLKELNVSRCGLSYLPAEIQKLRLVRFTSFPNPFLCPSKDARLTVRRCYGKWTGGAHDQVSVHDEPEPVLGSMGPPAVPSRARSSGAAARFASRSSFAAAGQRSGGDDEQIDTSSSQETTSLPVIARFLSTEFYADVAFPNLKEVCLRRLLQPVRDGDKKALGTLLEHYEAGSLSRLDRGINVETVRALEAARRSSAGIWDQYRPDSTRAETWCSGALADSHWSDDDMLDGRYDNSDDGHASAEWSSGDGHEAYRYQSNPRTRRDLEADLDQGDDAVGNPWFNRCPNPLHGHTENSIAVPSEVLSDWPSADATKVFAKPCVQRIEWVSHIGGYKVANTAVSSERLGIRDEKTKPLAENSGCIPILWRGCGVRCLDFLEAI